MSSRLRRRPGDIVVRRRRFRRETVRVSAPRRISITPRPWMIPAAFAVLIAAGTLVLSLPVSSESREWTSGWNSLFTSTSAVSVTGLTRFDTAEHWSGFGEAMIAVLIHVGGLGVTMYAGVLVLAIGGRFGMRGREFFGFELMDYGERDVRRLLRRVMAFTAVVEGGTLLLLLPWHLGREASVGAAWQATFHAISAFNNAGFDLMGGGQGFSGQLSSPYPIAVMSVAAFLGSLSFLTVFNMRRRPRFWTLDTRLVALGMFSLLLIGTALFALGEVQSGRTLDGLGPLEVLVNSVFLSVNRTTGMATIDMSQLHNATTTVLLGMMFIGGASTSTAGGIKMGAFMVSIIVVMSSLRGRHRAQAFGREIPQATVLRALSVTSLGLAALGVGTWLLALTDDIPFLPLLFEVMSALANVGWSQGVTSGLSTAGANVLVLLMFVGRFGSLIIALSIPDRPDERYRYVPGQVRIG